MPYSFVKAITVHHVKVPNTDQTNYPLCFSGTYSWLATVGAGGSVQSSSGYDIVFAADALGTIPLNFERAGWLGTTGQCEFYVQIPTVYHTADTVIYILYGNSAITTDQQHASSTWDSHYKGVFHTPFSTASVNDSTGTAVTFGTQTPSTGFGALQKSLAWVSSGAYSSGTVTYPTGTAERTLEIWFKIASGAAPPMTLAGIGTVFSVVNYSAFTLFFGGTSGAPMLAVDIYQDSTGLSWAPDSNWHHAAAVFPPSSTTVNQAKIYLDGVLQTTSGGSHTLVSVGANASIGVYPDHSTGTNMTGSTAELRISDIARSPDWIATHYNNLFSPTTFYTVGPPLPPQRGNIDYDQLRRTVRQGPAGMFQMFGGGTTATGHMAVYDASGNVIDGGAPSSGTALYCGQGSATAAAGNNTVTLGSTPLTNSLELFSAGVLISPSTYSVTGSAATVPTLTTGALIDAYWITTSATPGGITLSSPAVTLRNTASQTVNTATIAVAWPSGTVAGDLVVIFVGCQNNLTSPSGWTVLQNVGTSANWNNGGTFAKTMTSGDITAGSVTVTTSGTGGIVACAAAMQGAPNVRETDTNWANAAPGTAPITTSGAVAIGDLGLYFGSARASANPTCNIGTLRQQVNNGSNAAGALYTQAIVAAGAITGTYTYSGYNPQGHYESFVILKP